MAPSDKRLQFESTAVPLTRAVYNMALRLSRNGEDARDLVQETYLRAYRTFENFRPGTNCKAWLLTILYSIFVNKYRKEQREPRIVSLEEMETQFHQLLKANEQTEPNVLLESSVGKDLEVEAALRELPESFRSVVLLVDVEDLSYEEAAAALNCPVGTIRSRLFRARKLLFVLLEKYARQAGYGKGDTRKR